MFASRRILACAAVVSLVLLVLSVLGMARRIEGYYRDSDHRLYVWSRVSDRQFNYAGRPVTLADAVTPEGTGIVTVQYGDESLSLTPTIVPGDAQLPGMKRHDDWMQVLRFAEHGRTGVQELDRGVKMGQIADRLVVVVRTPPPGAGAGAERGVPQVLAVRFLRVQARGGVRAPAAELPARRQTEALAR